MGDVIRLAEHRAARTAGARLRVRHAPVVFHFDLSCPFSYLAAERVERLIPQARWRPTVAEALRDRLSGRDADAIDRSRAAAERRAHELKLPLVWPARHPRPVRAGMRAALRAAHYGHGPAFALAAARLAFCGGFDLDDPETLVEAAAASGMSLDACLRAGGETALDCALARPAARLLAAGADRLPAITVGGAAHCGDEIVAAAAAAARLASAGRVQAG
jgi:2-hydroxychromene-2-carboxylate isomerase